MTLPPSTPKAYRESRSLAVFVIGTTTVVCCILFRAFLTPNFPVAFSLAGHCEWAGFLLCVVAPFLSRRRIEWKIAISAIAFFAVGYAASLLRAFLFRW